MKKVRILIVKDEAIVAEDLEMAITGIGYEVVGRAASADEAVKKAVELKPDLILMDIVLRGEKNGIDASHEIKEKMGIPFIFLTAYSDIELIDKAKNTEPYAYILKPFQERQLLASIEMALYKSRMEKKLKKSKEFSSSLLTNSPNPILVINPDTSVRYVNPALEMLTGFSSAELVGKKAPYPWWTEETLEKTSRDLEEAMRKGATNLEELYQRKNGERFWVEITSTPVKSNGEFEYYLSNWVDVTERKRAEEMVRESEEKYRTVVESINDVVFALDKNGKFTYLSLRFEVVTGYLLEDLIGHSFTEVLAPEYIESTVDRFRRGLSGETIPLYEVELLLRDGRRLPIELNVTTILDTGGQPIGRLGVARDITERKRAEDLLRTAEQDWCDLFNSLEDVMLIIDREYNIENINEIGLKLLGKRKEEVIGKKCYQVIHGKDNPGEFCPFKETLKTKKVEATDRYEERFGKYFSIKSSPIFDENGEVIKSVDLMRDITEHKRAEEKIEASLREKEALLREIYHRVKNNLQIISSLLNMQAMKATDKNVIDSLLDSRSRIQMMSLIHTQLYQSEHLE